MQGEPGTNVGGMIGRIRQTMSDVTEKPIEEIRIRDVLAVDCQVPQRVAGGVAQEFSLENAVGLAAMVNTDRLLMERVAKAVSEEIRVPAELGGVEANMAILGALTTPGTDLPLAILDLGAGSTDAALLRRGEPVRSTHLAGAGHMVTLLINSELGLDDIEVAEQVKRYPLAKVESLFHIRNEDNTVRFFKEPLDAHLFGRVVSLDADQAVAHPYPAHDGAHPPGAPGGQAEGLCAQQLAGPLGDRPGRQSSADRFCGDRRRVGPGFRAAADADPAHGRLWRRDGLGQRAGHRGSGERRRHRVWCCTISSGSEVLGSRRGEVPV